MPGNNQSAYITSASRCQPSSYGANHPLVKSNTEKRPKSQLILHPVPGWVHAARYSALGSMEMSSTNSNCAEQGQAQMSNGTVDRGPWIYSPWMDLAIGKLLSGKRGPRGGANFQAARALFFDPGRRRDCSVHSGAVAGQPRVSCGFCFELPELYCARELASVYSGWCHLETSGFADRFAAPGYAAKCRGT
jgi:hypothetical protein